MCVIVSQACALQSTCCCHAEDPPFKRGNLDNFVSVTNKKKAPTWGRKPRSPGGRGGGGGCCAHLLLQCVTVAKWDGNVDIQKVSSSDWGWWLKMSRSPSLLRLASSCSHEVAIHCIAVDIQDCGMPPTTDIMCEMCDHEPVQVLSIDTSGETGVRTPCIIWEVHSSMVGQGET